MIVKICGLKDPQTATAAVSAGADMIGMVFARGPRFVDTKRAVKIARAVGGGALKVGVFRDEDPDFVNRVTREVGLDLVQLHGSEDPGYCRRMAAGVIKAIRVKDRWSICGIDDYLKVVHYVLLDSYSKSAAGGTGVTFDWSLASRVSCFGVPWILAGGLDPSNVSGAVRKCRPDGVDVSSGVESRPGVKNTKLIREFIKNAKGG